MYGADSGTLNVYHLDPSITVSGTTISTEPVWSESGDHGNQWLDAEVDTSGVGEVRSENQRL